MVLSPDGGGTLLENDGVKFFRFNKLPFRAKTIRGRLIDAYEIRPMSTFHAENFRAYWCPYEDSRISTTTVSNGANYMFTAAMNGCSFGVGTATSNGSRHVAHANMKGQPNAGPKQNALLGGMNLSDRLVDPTKYMQLSDKPLQVTTFGVRNPDTQQWRFYYQVNSVVPGAGGWERSLHGVFPA